MTLFLTVCGAALVLGAICLQRKNVGCGIILLFVSFFSALGAMGTYSSEREELATAQREAAAREARRADLKGDPEKFLAEAKELGDGGSPSRAYDVLVELEAALPNDDRIKKATEKARVAMVREKSEIQRQQSEIREKVRAATRQSMEKLLRERFLDGGLDIKVKVSGRNADQVKMTYALFNDVWSHRMDKDGVIDELCRAGFKQVRLTDGYDWGYRFTCN